MLQKLKERRQYRVTELIQTSEPTYNQCSFVFNGVKYHGEGKPLSGIHRTLSHHAYSWTIKDEKGRLLFRFGMHYAQSPISKRKLTRWMREYFKKKEAD